jgi:glycosyltransferase involved in cell wall biosynthesis
MPLRFSIVVPTLNRKDMLLSAIASVRAQDWPEVQIIVADGGSTDGTVEEISAQADIQVLSGPDQGVYDAFNKGIGQATGDVVGILNSDDTYESRVFTSVAEAFANDPTVDAVCGTALLVQNGRTVASFGRTEELLLSSPRGPLIGSSMINARFFRRAAMERIGHFSLEYRYVADRDWLVRWYEAGLRSAAIPRPLYRYQQHAGSLTFDLNRKNELAIREELVRLGRTWRRNPNAKGETRKIASLLEGRCIAKLAIDALQNARPADAARWIFCENGNYSLRPLHSVVRSCFDWTWQRTFRRNA